MTPPMLSEELRQMMGAGKNQSADNLMSIDIKPIVNGFGDEKSFLAIANEDSGISVDQKGKDGWKLEAEANDSKDFAVKDEVKTEGVDFDSELPGSVKMEEKIVDSVKTEESSSAPAKLECIHTPGRKGTKCFPLDGIVVILS